MKPRTSLLIATILIAAAASPRASAHDAASLGAEQILRDMGRTVGSAKQFSFKARRQADASLVNGLDPAEESRVSVTVSRPGKLAAISQSKNGTRKIFADGERFTLLDAKHNVYATVPMKTTLDGLVDIVDAKYGFTPPLAEFVVSDPYKDIRANAKSVSHLGRATVSGGLFAPKAECHRLALKGRVFDAELWVGVKDHLPRKLVATFKDRPGSPQLRITFTEWNLSAKPAAGAFTHTPSKGAVPVAMMTTAEMDAARKKTAAKKH